MSATITWGELEKGHRITGGWVVADLTPTHITVASDEDGELSTFKRKDPWEPVEVEPLRVQHVAELFGGHVIREDWDDGRVTFYAWPDDPAFINAAQSHLAREHEVDPEDRDYEELRWLHQQLHETCSSTGHEHVARVD